MKNYFMFIGAALLLSACNQGKIDNLTKQNDSLLIVANEQNAALNEFVTSFNEVESGLDSVARRQHVISLTTNQTGELKPDQEARINAEIAAINSMMDDNRKKIAELNRKLKNSAGVNAELRKTIATLNSQLAQKDVELAALNTRLAELNAQVAQLQITVSSLNEENAAQSEIIANDTRTMHTAYYVVGKSKDLAEAKIIDREGGLMGIGKTSKLSADIDNSKYTQIDYTVTTSIEVNGIDVKMITTHPTDSYTMEMDSKDKKKVLNLVISNPEKFWSASKYLVIVKK